jgi:hypothetical protein
MGTKLAVLAAPLALSLSLVGCGREKQAAPPRHDSMPAGAQASTEPPRQIPAELYDAFTMNGAMAVKDWYRNDSYSPSEPKVYTKQQIEALEERARLKLPGGYGATDEYLFQALDQFRERIEGKDVAIIGSTRPWYESIVLAYGGKPTTIEYNALVSEDPRLTVMTVKEYEANPTQFDAALSISSYEHDGLGRYGDPINPDGDLNAMKNARAMLRKGGLMFVAVPVGLDTVVWNVHRVYGRSRLPRFLEGWEVLASFGFEDSDLDREASFQYHQPVFVLTPK